VSRTATLVDLLDGDDADVMVLDGEQRTTRRELRALAVRVEEQLRGADLAGRAIGVLLPNTADAIGAWFGVWATGGAFVPLNPRVPAAELGRLVAATGVGAVVTSPDLITLLPAGDAERRDVAPYVLVEYDPTRARAVEPGAAIVQFTSGTTGVPKPVVLRHDTVSDLLDSVIGTLRGDRQAARATMPNLVPMSLALWAGIYQVLFAFKLGVPVVLMSRFEPREFARLVGRHGIKSSVLPPAALVMLMEDPTIATLAPLRYIRSVSAPLSPAHARKFYERFGIAILNGYGQTELGGEAVGWSAADWKRHGVEKLGSVGRPHAAFELRVRADDGGIAGGDEIGELEIKSSAALPPADAAMAGADLQGRVTDDGWLRTGDLARIDDDGFVWIEGRVSAMINRGGLKVFPDEVEERLRGHPSVLDAAVVGVADDRLGEVPWAFVVPAGTNADLDLDVLRAWCRDTLAPYKVPVELTVVASLPRNEMGKVLRQELVP
jgi:acyl-CoA synthetase (AMP-forming)/AMP-acid ligase II